MRTVDDYARIRLAHRDGMSIRQIASTFHHSRRKVRAVLAQPQPTPYTRTQPPPAPVLGAFHRAIDALLAADADAPPKQRHTAMQVFRRFEALFCMPARGNEKPRAETRVRVLQQQWATPVPGVADLD